MFPCVGKYTHFVVAERGVEAKSPPWQRLGKGGVDAPSRNVPVPLKGADGVVRSNSKTKALLVSLV